MLANFRRKRAGRRYEAFVADLMRQQGWAVTERTDLGFDDEGIDMIASKGLRMAYVQCKGWNKHKQLHENVVDHLYGSVAYQVGPQNVHTVDVLLFTSTELTPHAVAHAKKLGVQVLHERF